MSASRYQSASERRRGTALTLAIIAHLLVLLAMIYAAPKTEPKPQKEPTSFTMLPPSSDREAAAAAKPKASTAEKKKQAKAAPPTAPTLPKPPILPKAQKVPVPEMPELIGGKEMFEAADISKLGSRGSASGESNSGKDSGAAYGPGAGPGGERLYNAEWYREPTRAELATYLPTNVQPPAWALIACRTAEDMRVENCRSLGESPLGSGLSRGLRQAAWQFRVRPPRVGGKPQIGAWVRIYFDFTTGKVE